MKTIEIAEKYETTHVDSDALLGQSETKEGVGVIIAVVFNGEARRSLEVDSFSLGGKEVRGSVARLCTIYGRSAITDTSRA